MDVADSQDSPQNHQLQGALFQSVDPSGRRRSQRLEHHAERGASVTTEKTAKLVNALGEQWAEGAQRLDLLVKLFGEAKHVELLNLVGGELFADIQRVLQDDLVLRVSRLTDPQSSGGGKDNLTIQRLPALCERDELRKEVQEQVDAAVRAASTAREHRNQRISHTDLTYALGDSELESNTLRQLRKVLDAVHAAVELLGRELKLPHWPKGLFVAQHAEMFQRSLETLVDAVRELDELRPAGPEGRPPVWDREAASNCVRALGSLPSSENVQRIIDLRSAAQWLRMRKQVLAEDSETT